MGPDFLQLFFSRSLCQQCPWLNFSAKWKPSVCRLWAVRWGLPTVADQALTPPRHKALRSPLHGQELAQLPSDRRLEANCSLLCPLNQASYFAPLQLCRLVLSASALLGSRTPCKLISESGTTPFLGDENLTQ